MAISLNIPQERELARLIDYERSTCSVEGELVYRCAFPYRPDDELQAELIDAGALAHRIECRAGVIYGPFNPVYGFGAVFMTVCLYWLREKRDARLIGLSALFAALCVVAGFLLGRFLA